MKQANGYEFHLIFGMLIGMKLTVNPALLGLVIGVAFCAGCAAARRNVVHEPSAATNLPQLVRVASVNDVKRKPGVLFIAGRGSAAADGGKNTFTARGPFSGYPAIEMTIQSDNASALDDCMQRVRAIQENHQTIDIRGRGIFTIKSAIDPPVETGLFTLTTLESCGVAVSTDTHGAVSAADLVAVPERYLDRKTVIQGRLTSVVHFSDPASSFTIEAEGQSLSAYFLTQSLPAESRLALVHAKLGSLLTLEGTLIHTTENKFNVANVVAIKED
jgi:hypothetical protein